jgi:uncharacterized protein involved in exopolysaccharide biosynthesis
MEPAEPRSQGIGRETGRQEGMEAIEDRRETSMRDYLAVIFRRKGVALGVFLASLGVVALLQLSSPPVFESTSQVLVSRGQPESAYNPAVRVALSWEEELNSEIETARSAHIVQMAQKILDDGKIRDARGEKIQIDPGQITTSTISKSSVIYIKYRSPEKLAAQEGTRALTQAYVNFRLSVRSVPELEAYFRDEIEGVKDQLEDWEQKRADFMNEESVSRIPDERNSLLIVRQNADVDLGRVRESLAEAQARVEVLQRAIAQAESDSSAGPYVYTDLGSHDDQAIGTVKAQLVARQSEYLGMRAQYQDSHPQVMALKDQVEELRAMLDREVRSYLKLCHGKVEILRAREESLLSTISYVDAELGSFPSKEARLASFDRVIDALKADYTALVDKQIQARLERIGVSDWNVLVLQPACEPELLRLHDAIRLTLIPLIGLIVGMALAFLVDGLDHSVKDATEVEQYLGLPVLGSLGHLR